MVSLHDIACLPKEDILRMAESIDRLADEVSKHSSNPKHVVLTNEETQKFLNVSSKTLTKWRNDGKIGFSQSGRSIFFRLSDILTFLEDCYKPPFSKN